MFRRDVQSISDLLNMYLRREGLETPLLQKRAVDAWDTLMGPSIARYTGASSGPHHDALTYCEAYQ